MTIGWPEPALREHRHGRVGVLHVPYTFFPDASGGTEVYVDGLAQRLGALGFPSAVAAPGSSPGSYRYHGIEVHRFATDTSARIEFAYGEPDEVAATAFERVFETVRPGIVHLHARTSAVSELLVDLAHTHGALVVLTYHTPTVSCARGTMMLDGERACDGRLVRRRCMTCALSAHGAPRWLGGLASRMPDRLDGIGGALARHAPKARALRSPSLIGRSLDRVHAFLDKVDHVVTVCQWVKDVLDRNGVPADKVTLSRQGISDRGVRTAPASAARRGAGGPLRLAYFGRVGHAKGPDLLVAALAKAQDCDSVLDIFAVRPEPGTDGEYRALQSMAAGDRRIALHPAVPTEDAIGRMACYDVIAVPSRGLETGPLVVLEAFAARVPVLGADHGGIAELVRNDIDGVLARPDDAGAWGEAIARLAADRAQVARLKAGIAPPRTMDAAAQDMAALYARVLTERQPQRGRV
jgi:glycosyltransferase involved in cell wall biosynthesis